MKKNALRLTLILAIPLALAACHHPLAHPELVDPVYLDITKDADATFKALTQTKKDLQKAKDDYDKAPIRTGQKDDARDHYFEVSHTLETQIEKYRYFVLKAELRKKFDQVTYAHAFKDKKPWPDMQSYFEYETEKRLVNAPREWDPDAQIKKRAPASTKDASKTQE